MTVNGELTKLQTSIDAITVSLENKGQAVSPADTLVTYKQKILNVPNRTVHRIELCPEVVSGDIKEITDTQSTILRSRCFCDCQMLESASFEKVKKINIFAFEKCFRLKKLYLHYEDDVVVLVDKCAFRYTPLEELQGNIYVPPSLYNRYLEDNSWKYFRNIIKPIGADLITTTLTFVVPGGYSDEYQFI